MSKRAVSTVRASTSQVTLGSDLPREKVELAFKLLEVSSRIFRILHHRSSSILIFYFCRKRWDRRVADPKMRQS